VGFNDLPPAGPSFGDPVVGNFDFEGRGDRDGRAHLIQTVTDIDPEYDPGTLDPEQPPAGGDPVRGVVVQVAYVFEDGSQITTKASRRSRASTSGRAAPSRSRAARATSGAPRAPLTVRWVEFGETFERTEDHFDFTNR
jgi:hypothetical protein